MVLFDSAVEPPYLFSLGGSMTHRLRLPWGEHSDRLGRALLPMALALASMMVFAPSAEAQAFCWYCDNVIEDFLDPPPGCWASNGTGEAGAVWCENSYAETGWPGCLEWGAGQCDPCLGCDGWTEGPISGPCEFDVPVLLFASETLSARHGIGSQAPPSEPGGSDGSVRHSMSVDRLVEEGNPPRFRFASRPR